MEDGNLDAEKTFGFTDDEKAEMREACKGLQNWINSPQPFLIVCIIDKLYRTRS